MRNAIVNFKASAVANLQSVMGAGAELDVLQNVTEFNRALQRGGVYDKVLFWHPYPVEADEDQSVLIEHSEALEEMNTLLQHSSEPPEVWIMEKTREACAYDYERLGAIVDLVIVHAQSKGALGPILQCALSATVSSVKVKRNLVGLYDAEEYEIPETGYKISYVLTQDEMYKCLYNSNMFKTKGTRAVVESIILGIAAVIFFTIYFTTTSQYNHYNLIFGIISLVTIAIIWIVPHIYLKRMSAMMADGKTIEAEIYPTHIDIGRNDGKWSIELDGKAQIQEFDNIIMIFTDHDRAFAIPERVIEPDVYNEVRAILMSGTDPDEEE